MDKLEPPLDLKVYFLFHDNMQEVDFKTEKL